MWCDLTGDGRPELLVVTRDSRIHALTVDLTPRPVVTWSRPWFRSAGQAAGPGGDEATRVRARDAWGDGNWAEALAAGAAGRTAEASWIAAMAAHRLGNRDLLLKHAAEARARGCRRLDLAATSASVLPPGEVREALVAALAVAPMEELRAWVPDEALAADGRAAAALAREAAESAGDWERAIALAAICLPWDDISSCAARALAAGADRGPILLARGRAALRLDRIGEAAADLREASLRGSSMVEARKEWRALDMQAVDDGLEAARLYDAGDGRSAIRLAERAALVQPDNADRWNELAWYLATSRGATPADARRAVECASRAVELKRRSGPSVALAAILDTLAVAHAATGDFAKAAAVEREALSVLPEDARRSEYEKQLAEFEREAEKRR